MHPRYDREKLLKIVLFAFMEFGYCSVRFIQKLCETDILFLWLLCSFLSKKRSAAIK